MEENKEMPKIYSDRDLIKNDRYVFVSYSHKDSEEVYDVLTRLYDKGINYWYDKDFKIGDKWNEEAYKKLSDKNCVGAIVFVTENTIISDACYKEVKKILELSKHSAFKVIPILIKYNTMNEAYGDITRKVKRNEIPDIEKMEHSIDDKLEAFDEITGSDTIIFSRYDNSNYSWIDKLEEVFQIINVVQYQIFNLKKTNFIKLSDVTIENNNYYLKCGQYDFEDEKVLEKIEWKAIKQEIEILYLVSTYVIDYITRDDVNRIIRKVRETMKNIDYIESIDIINTEQLNSLKDEIGDFIPTDYADKNRTQMLRLNFIRDSKDEDKIVFCNYSGEIIETTENIENMTYGIRLILKIDINKIKENENG